MLWIRNQNKHDLVLCGNFKVRQARTLQNYRYVISDDWNIWNIRSGEDEDLLGTYATEERALEVIDEIQDVLNGNKPVIGTKYIDGNPYDIISEVYLMPKE